MTALLSSLLLLTVNQHESTRVFVVVFCLGCVLTYATAAANIFHVHGAQLHTMTTTTAATTAILTASLDDCKTSFDADIIKIDGGVWGGDGDADDRSSSRAMALALARVSFVLSALERQGLVDRERDVEPLVALFHENQQQANSRTKDSALNDVSDTEVLRSDSLYGLHSPPTTTTTTAVATKTISWLRDHSVTSITSSTVSNPMHRPTGPGQGPRQGSRPGTLSTTTTSAISTTASAMV